MIPSDKQSHRGTRSMAMSSRVHPTFGRRGRVGTRATPRGRALRSASALPVTSAEERWSPRRTLAFVIVLSAGLWGVIGLIAYGGIQLWRR